MHPLPLISWTRSGSPLRHLETYANQNLRHTWGVSSGKALHLTEVDWIPGQVFPWCLSPHHRMSLVTKRHIQRWGGPHQQQVAWGEEQIPHVSAAQFQEPFRYGTKTYGSWISAEKETHEGTNPTAHGSVREAGWGLGDLIQFFTVTQKSAVFV